MDLLGGQSFRARTFSYPVELLGPALHPIFLPGSSDSKSLLGKSDQFSQSPKSGRYFHKLKIKDTTILSSLSMAILSYNFSERLRLKRFYNFLFFILPKVSLFSPVFGPLEGRD